MELERLYKESTHHVLRQRCQIILLKASHRKTSNICAIVGIKSENQVNKWVKRYKNEHASLGIQCLRNLEGQGRKSIFDSETESELIQRIVKAERQKLENAKIILEKN
ncbi:helix-turn-helix domain-containing protein [Chryseobacterium sp. ERMR1:04]|uniref:helix-turn-helix domain-containing protein n=1 Tax=Chryseobacterium sp. ERMR1:04 TaxID=1705393 RepID=UPI000F4D700D|nr:helix-turn-helix domain-containing protein [Chryseobacterium sp. ERMR1:04]